MAASLASDRPNLPAPGDNDPFVTSTPAPAHHRYSTFDHDLFASGPASSPGQAKRALEAHLVETERRLEEAGKLGNALVSQRKALTEQLHEVEKLQAEGELNPELRQKLVDIEKEYNDLARESARAFLPKQRVPSNEANPNSPFVPEGRSGRRSVSPSKFESQATGSPTKLSVPNRKLRNQPSNRVHDIEFAAEISTSLIAQVRNLQALLAEREEEVKDLKYDKSVLEIESESFQQRLKALDESEHRYKEENWNLETKLQETSAQQKEAADREKKLTQSLNLIKSEKVSVQKELDEVKLSNSKLTEEHSAAVKHLDIELGTAKRNMAMAEGERSAMQRKIDELTSQNQELAKAFSIQRGRTLEREATFNSSDDDREASADQVTPEHSPPPSPIKGTPRHSMLETETMKSSLHHAQRTIQSQRSLLHREKTEKLELRRIIQDLRDDLEKSRTESNSSSSNRRSRKADPRDSKRVPRLLGSFRSSRHEVVHDDADWEDQQDLSPRTSAAVSPVTRQNATFSAPADSSDHFETANEGGESAFETANERGTETEDFQTVNEEFSGSDDADTETEGRPSRGFGRMKQPPSLPAGLARHSNRDSFISTASTSADEDDFAQLRTPTATMSSQRSSRFRFSRGVFSRNARQPSEEPVFRSSPASFTSSAAGTPQGGQSLFAELQDFEGSDDESVGGATPSKRGIRSSTPGSFSQAISPIPAVPPLPKVVMVDSSMMTDPVRFAPSPRDLQISALVDSAQDESVPGSPVSVVARGRPMSMESVAGPIGNRFSHPWPSLHEEYLDDSRPMSMIYSDAGAQHDPDMEEKLAQFPAPPTMFAPILPPRPDLSMSSISSETVEPREEIHIPPSLSFTSILNQSFEPQAEPEIPPPKLSISGIMAENLEPRAVPPPLLSLSSITAEDLEPQAIPPPKLSISGIIAEDLEPQAIPPPALILSSIAAENFEPQAIPPPALSLSSIAAENLEPRAIPPPALSLSGIAAEHLEPRPVPPPQLSLSNIAAEHLEPRAVPPPQLSLSNISTENLEPQAIPPPELSLSGISAEHLEPRAVPPPELSLSSIATEDLEPQAIPPPELSLSRISAENLEPRAVPPPELSLSNISTENLAPRAIPPPELSLSGISSEHLEPRAAPPPTLAFSNIAAEHLEPRAEPEVPPPRLSLSTIAAEHLVPQEIPLPELSMASIVSEDLKPVAEPETPPPALTMSSIIAENLEPRAETEIPPPELSLSTIMAKGVEPRAEPDTPPPQLTFTGLATERVEPIYEPEVPLPVFGLSAIISESLEPVEEPPVKPVMVFPPPPSLTLSQIFGEHVEPVSAVLPVLTFSALSREHVEPVAFKSPQLGLSPIAVEQVHPIAEPAPKLPEPVLPTLSLSMVQIQHTEPIAEPEPEVVLRAIPEPAKLNLSSIVSENVEPIAEPEPKAPEAPKLTLTTISSEHCEPIAEPEPEPVLPELSISTIMHEHVQPIAVIPPALTLSALSTEHVEPLPEPEPVVPQLSISSIRYENVQPIAAVLPTLTLSSISTERVEPLSEPEPVVPQLSVSLIQHQHIQPIAVVPPALTLSSISIERVEPRLEPEPVAPQLSISSIRYENVQPVPVVLPALSLSPISTERVEPLPEPEPVAPQLSISSIRHETLEPVPTQLPPLATSSIMMESVDPVPEPLILPPSLNLSSIYTEQWEPKEEPRFIPPSPALTYSHVSTQYVEPVLEPEPLPPSLALSSIFAENVRPIFEPEPHFVLSSIVAEGVEPVTPVREEPAVPKFDFSAIEYVETRPISPRSPKRDGLILPRGLQYPFLGQGLGLTSNKIFGSNLVRTQDSEFSPIIAEDETSQDVEDLPEAKTLGSRQPFQDISSSNLNQRPSDKDPVETSDQGAQTALTAEVIDEMFKARTRSTTASDKNTSVASFGTPGTTGTTGTVRIRRSQESFGSPLRHKGKYADDFASDTGSIRRPGSATSGMHSIQDVPPLPSNHRQVIEAARSDSAHGPQTNMPPPLWPASALKQRPITPSQTRPMSGGTPTPRAGRVGANQGSLDVPSPQKLSAISRQSSVSSFASELDSRFNMRPGDMGIDPTGFGPNTDPRMIQAITQTMIGEYLWKYTRKTGRGEMSGNRHRRYFWVHPYTRTLYWSERDPTTAGRTELKAKSVPIEAVRVVTDDNPMPPGLHRKSLVIISPGRTVKFTCTTGQRHETWFNALSYLLLRTNNNGNNIDNQSDAEDLTESITREDVEEFNPQYGRQYSRPHAPPSLSSYNSRTTRNESPAVGMSMNIPTLTSHKVSGQRANTGTLSKLSGYWKSSQGLSGTFSSRRGRGVSGQDANIYEAGEVHDSAEDLREMIERQDREADRLENVRACCDGKHDVGTLHHHGRRGRSHHHHAHTNVPSTSTPMASMRSRA